MYAFEESPLVSRSTHLASLVGELENRRWNPDQVDKEEWR
jgi:hypothetical protein